MQPYRQDRSTRITLPEVCLPVPKNDFRTYERVSASLAGVREMLEEYRSNEGRIGYGALNPAMSCSKASIALDALAADPDCENRDEMVAEADLYRGNIDNLVEQFQMASLPESMQELLGSGQGHALAAWGREQKINMIHQENTEATLFSLFFPAVINLCDIPALPTVKDFSCPVQAVLAAYQDLAGELAKRLDDFMVFGSGTSMSTDDQFARYDHLVRAIRSLHHKLDEFKGVPGNIVSNSFWRGSFFRDKQFRLGMLLIRQVGDQEKRLFQKKVANELLAKIRN